MILQYISLGSQEYISYNRVTRNIQIENSILKCDFTFLLMWKKLGKTLGKLQTTLKDKLDFGREKTFQVEDSAWKWTKDIV